MHRTPEVRLLSKSGVCVVNGLCLITPANILYIAEIASGLQRFAYRTVRSLSYIRREPVQIIVRRVKMTRHISEPLLHPYNEPPSFSQFFIFNMERIDHVLQVKVNRFRLSYERFVSVCVEVRSHLFRWVINRSNKLG